MLLLSCVPNVQLSVLLAALLLRLTIFLLFLKLLSYVGVLLLMKRVHLMAILLAFSLLLLSSLLFPGVPAVAGLCLRLCSCWL